MNNRVELAQKVWYVTYNKKDYTVYENLEPFNCYYEIYHNGKKLEEDDSLVEIIWKVVKEYDQEN